MIAPIVIAARENAQVKQMVFCIQRLAENIIGFEPQVMAKPNGREGFTSLIGQMLTKYPCGFGTEGLVGFPCRGFRIHCITGYQAVTAIKNAYFDNTAIGIAAMDGGIASSGSQGLWADCMITDFSRDELLEDAISVKVTAKPTYSANPPIWKTVASTS